jgi:flagellar motility protein MotE (MotC chaperone)
MKTVLVSIVLALLVVTTSIPKKPKKEEIDVDVILSKCDKNLSKASTVAKVADQQQKEKMSELHQTVQKLEKEKKQLETVLTETKYELQVVKDIVNNNVVDTGEQYNLLPEN